jgi:hypothetical protein
METVLMNTSEPKQILTSHGERPRLLARDVYNVDLASAIDELQEPDLVKAALHVLNDDIDCAHGIAQQHEGNPTSDYWHAIVHRREGDFGNAKYWFARVGEHPVVKEIYGDTTGAVAFVDRCRGIGAGRDTEAEELQWREMLVLLDYSERGTGR